jgi:methionine-rich copper-binding protein CopC
MNHSTKCVAAVAAFFLLWAGLTNAHTQLSSSVPADQAVVDSAPAELSLTFSEPVRLTAVSVASDVDRQALEVTVSEPATAFTIALPRLASGAYVVEWRALSADTHVMSGEIRFTVSS